MVRLLALGAILLVGCTTASTRTLPTVVPVRTAGPSLQLQSAHCARTGDLLDCTGSVTNLSSETLINVEAKVDVGRAAGVPPETSNTALIDIDHLAPGQTSRWEVIVNRYNGLADYRFSFRDFHSGALLQTRDAR